MKRITWNIELREKNVYNESEAMLVFPKYHLEKNNNIQLLCLSYCFYMN